MKQIAFLCVSIAIILIIPNTNYAQGLAINATGSSADSSAILDCSSTSKGLLTPRMDSSQRVGIINPATGLLVYQTNGTTPGFYFYNGSGWTLLGSTLGNTPFKKTKIIYTLSSGTTDSALTANAWTTRRLNTILYDDIGVSLSSNQISLPAGTYEVSAVCLFNNANFTVGIQKTRIRNITASTTVGYSLNAAMSVAANYSAYPAFINNERFTLSTTSVLELQYYIDVASPARGYNNPAQKEVYAEVIITKL